MTLYFDNTSIEITPNDSSYLYEAIQGDHSITISFKYWEYLNIPVGAHVTYNNIVYTLYTPQNFTKSSTREYEYTLILEAPQGALKQYILRNLVDGRLEFSTVLKPQEFLQLIVDNLNSKPNQSGWEVGTYIDSVEKLIAFNHVTLSDAGSLIAEAFDTEFHIVDKTISLGKLQINEDAPLPLSYGKGNGLVPGVGRSNIDDQNMFEILYVQGGDKNINMATYGSKNLKLPSNEIIEYKSNTYRSSIDGLSISNDKVPLKSYKEASVDLTKIYPKRVGTCEQVITVNVDKHFYDIVDTTIPENLDYEHYQIPGQKLTIVFESGQLAGREFECNYKHSNRRFEIVPVEIDGVLMPAPTYIPVAGDKYAIFNCTLPHEYISDDDTKTGASWDLFLEAAKYMYQNQFPRYTFTGILDGIYANANWSSIANYLKVRGSIKFVDPQFLPNGEVLRIISIKTPINNPHYLELSFSNTLVGSNVGTALDKADTQEIRIKDSDADTKQFARRRFKDVEQTTDLLQKSLLDFSESINPITLKTMQALVGDTSLQYKFINTFNQVVSDTLTYDKVSKKLSIQNCRIQHMTLGINTLSATHSEDEYLKWNISEKQILLPDDKVPYYVYLQVEKNSTIGQLITTTVPIDYKHTTYYFLLMAIINIVDTNNDRSISRLYGYTEILPGQMTVDRIVSSDGTNYMDFVSKEAKIGEPDSYLSYVPGEGVVVKGKLIAESGSTVYNKDEVDDSFQQASDDLQTYKNTVTNDFATINTDIANLQGQIDGAIESFNGTDIPTLTNYPANTWTDDVIKRKHINDFYNITAVESGQTVIKATYKFIDDNGVFKWLEIKSTQGAAAILIAEQAIQLAGTKAKVLYSNDPPISPYFINDIWIKVSDNQMYLSKYNVSNPGRQTADDWQLVNDAQLRVAKMVADNVISKEEKVQLKNTRDQIQKEFAEYQTDAVTYSVDITALDNAYTALWRNLRDVLQVNYTVDTNITTDQKQASNGYFADYYAERTNFANLIAKAISDKGLLTKNTIFKGAGPSPLVEYHVGDLWVDITNTDALALGYKGCILVCIRDGVGGGGLDMSDWKLSNTYDNTKTVIDGGIVTSGTVQLAGEGGAINAGITGDGISTTSTRFWAGDTFQNKWRAPFRVRQDGSLYATKADITGEITATSGKIAGFNIAGQGITNDTSIAYITFLSNNVRASIGTSAASPSAGVNCGGRFESNTTGFGNQNWALLLKASGGTENYAINITAGAIAGLGIKARRSYESTTLTQADVYLSMYNTSTKYVYLPTPSSSNVGKIYYVRRMNDSSPILSGKMHGHYGSMSTGTIGTKKGDTAVLVCDGQFWCYSYMSC